eukprot:TRINITY_DN1533_c0_g1_i6.p1 TRINITY_DN1533_c0_g1~~TRINITY_DN1533_c0_g1_i6.p1  ORF type:complete len:160 (+),score=3.48 TRINITY_DN1533_c0_g1_i6:51-530(+)
MELLARNTSLRLAGSNISCRAAAIIKKRLATLHHQSLVEFSQADPTLRRDVEVYPDFITQEQHDALVEQLAPVFQRKRYEKGHWDAVITDYKESERADESWNQANRDTIEQVLLRAAGRRALPLHARGVACRRGRRSHLARQGVPARQAHQPHLPRRAR